MTCIVGVVDGESVYIGADSAGVDADTWTLVSRSDPKVFQVGPFVIGYTSSFRMGQLLRFAFSPPTHPDGLDTHAYMVTVFVDSLRECFGAGGYAMKQNERESAGTFLVGYRGRLFEIGDDYQVGESHDEYAAIGCGGALALGALAATTDDQDARHRIRRALQAAEKHNIGVRGPFVVLVSE